MHAIGRLGVRGRVRVLEAAALVDGDVDEHRARLHPRHEVVADQRRGLRARDEHRADDQVGVEHGALALVGGGRAGLAVARDEHRADDQVGVEHGALDLVGIGRDGLAVALVDGIDLAQPGHVLVEQQHLRLHAERDGGRVDPRDAGSDDDDLGRVHAGHTTHQGAAATALRHEVVRADLRGEATCDLGHRGEQRQRAVGQLHGLVAEGAVSGERAAPAGPGGGVHRG